MCRAGQSGMHSIAEQPRLELLIGTQPSYIDDRVGPCWAIGAVTSSTRRWTSHQPIVIPPVEAHPRTTLPGLVLHVSRHVELFVVIDTEGPHCGRHCAGSSDLRREDSGGHTR